VHYYPIDTNTRQATTPAALSYIYIYIYIYVLYISHIIQLTPQQQSTEPRNSAGAGALAVARRPKEAIEGEDPAAAGIERFFSLKGPQ